MTRVIVGQLQIGKLLGRRLPALVFGNVAIAIGLSVWILDGHLLWFFFLWNALRRGTQAGSVQSKCLSDLLRLLVRHRAHASLIQFG